MAFQIANRNYQFLRGILIGKSNSSNLDPQKTHINLYTKYTENVNGSKLGHQNHIPIPLCVTKLICSLAPDKNKNI